ncbi:MAG: hypothetical protein IKZ53_10910 [Selenomonadaceae bacterium]|nr:hypothetical protein [Selenomonadaceae bacterium]
MFVNRSYSFKGLMNEVDDDTAFKKINPKRRNGNALSDRIGSDERASNLRAVNEVSGFLEPTRNIIEIAIAGNALENRCHVRFLRGRLKTFADKGRIPYDIVWLRTDILPIEL